MSIPPSASSVSTQSLLFKLKSIDPEDPVERELSEKFSKLMDTISKLGPNEVAAYLLQQTAQGAERHAYIASALVYGVLTSPEQAAVYFQFLHTIVQDGWHSVIADLRYFAHQRFRFMQETACSQLFWLVDRLVALNAVGIDSICISLLRQVRAGNVGISNLTLLDRIYDILDRNQTWLHQHTRLLQIFVYAGLRWIAEPTKELCHAKIISLTLNLLTENFAECASIGRDLIRALQDVSAIPQFHQFWTKLLHSPSSISPNCKGIERILLTPTHKKIHLARITPEMETDLLFLLEHVRLGHEKRYQTWFVQRWFQGHDAEGLICDIVRWIVAVVHPPNSILASDIIQRWAAIGWLLKCLRSNYGAANVKLALFYDWFFFDENIDSIMDLEPGLLVMARSMNKYPNITCTLIDFLCLAADDYFPPMKTEIRRCLDRAMVLSVSKGVISSIQVFVKGPGVPADLCQRLVQIFPSSSNEQPIRIAANSKLRKMSHDSDLPPSKQTKIQDAMSIKTDTAAFELAFHKVKVLINMDVVEDIASGLMYRLVHEAILLGQSMSEAIKNNLVEFLKSAFTPTIPRLQFDGPWNRSLQKSILKTIGTADGKTFWMGLWPRVFSTDILFVLFVFIVSGDQEDAAIFDELFRTSEKATSPSHLTLLEKLKLEDHNRFYEYVPSAFKIFRSDLLPDYTKLLKLIFEDIDPAGFVLLSSNAGILNLVPFIPELIDAVVDSLEWTSYEQLFLWQMLNQSFLTSSSSMPENFLHDFVRRLLFLADRIAHAEMWTGLRFLLSAQMQLCNSEFTWLLRLEALPADGELLVEQALCLFCSVDQNSFQAGLSDLVKSSSDDLLNTSEHAAQRLAMLARLFQKP